MGGGSDGKDRVVVIAVVTGDRSSITVWWF